MNTTMPDPSTDLLEQAYQLIDANQLENAKLMLDAVVRVEPQNVEAWRIYLKIFNNQSGLDWLKERVIKTKELNESDKNEIINYHFHLTQQLNGGEKIAFNTNTFTLPQKEIFTPEEPAVRFELIDVFDYPVTTVKKETRTRIRRRAFYNTFIFDVANGVLKVISNYPTGKKIADYIQKMSALANDLVKNRKHYLTLFLESAYFEKSIGVALLIFCILGIDLVASNSFLGYLFLGIFIILGGWWLVNFGSQGTNSLSNQARVYFENINGLPVLKDVKTDQGEKSDKDII